MQLYKKKKNRKNNTLKYEIKHCTKTDRRANRTDININRPNRICYRFFVVIISLKIVQSLLKFGILFVLSVDFILLSS